MSSEELFIWICIAVTFGAVPGWLGWLILATGPQTAARGVMIALAVWAGFIASAFATEYVFEGRSLQIFAINTGYPLVGLLIMGIVLGAWKK